MSHAELTALYARAEMLLNLHGGTEPTDELAGTGRLVYLETDPVQLQVELHEGNADTEAFLDAHVAWFTFGENWGRAGNPLPAADRYPFRPTRQPVVVDHWRTDRPAGSVFTTIANWRQRWREVHLGGESYTWSKDLQFEPVRDLPRRVDATFELTLSGHEPADTDRLRALGWLTRDALPATLDPDRYRDYVQRSRGEFTAAKDQNVRLRSGWFSDRSATYLAAGRPVITQDTGVGSVLPVGEGLHVWHDLDSAVAAVERVLARPAAEAAAAAEIGREYFGHDRVLGALMSDLGMTPRPQRLRAGAAPTPDPAPWPADLPVGVRSRRPLVLADDAEARILAAPVPRTLPTVAPDRPVATVVVPVCDNLALTRLCLESILSDRRSRDAHVVVVDNGSVDLTAAYLDQLAARAPNLRVLHLDTNVGYAAATNLGVAAGAVEGHDDAVVLVNNDVVVTPGWLDGLLAQLADGVGAVVPVTDGAPGAARVERTWRTYGELVDAARRRRAEHGDAHVELERATYCCVALRRSTWDRVGPLDEGYGIGMFEDDDHLERLRALGCSIRLALGVLVAHFGEATLGTLAPSGAYGELFHRNRARFEARHGRAWTPHEPPPDAAYRALVTELRDLVRRHVPEGDGVAVVSKGDPSLVEVEGRRGWHLPGDERGAWAGHHPADGPSAVGALERVVRDGARFVLLPRPQLWWLDTYPELAEHLDAHFERVVDGDAGLLFQRSAR
jgi:GT2 family glycosyltransferase